MVPPSIWAQEQEAKPKERIWGRLGIQEGRVCGTWECHLYAVVISGTICSDSRALFRTEPGRSTRSHYGYELFLLFRHDGHCPGAEG